MWHRDLPETMAKVIVVALLICPCECQSFFKAYDQLIEDFLQ